MSEVVAFERKTGQVWALSLDEKGSFRVSEGWDDKVQGPFMAEQEEREFRKPLSALPSAIVYFECDDGVECLWNGSARAMKVSRGFICTLSSSGLVHLVMEKRKVAIRLSGDNKPTLHHI